MAMSAGVRILAGQQAAGVSLADSPFKALRMEENQDDLACRQDADSTCICVCILLPPAAHQAELKSEMTSGSTFGFMPI
jgi:hypothetical protein